MSDTRDDAMPDYEITASFVLATDLMALIEDGEIAGTVVLRDEDGNVERQVGVISFDRNANDDPMVTVTKVLDPDYVLVRTFIENVERITVP